MNAKRHPPIAFAVSVLAALAILACDLTGSGAPTDTPVPPPTPTSTSSPTSTPSPTAIPATATSAPSPTVEPPTATATLTPTSTIILVIAGPDKKIGLVTFDGQSLPLSR